MVKARHKPLIDLVESRVAELQRVPADALRSLPAYVETKIEINDRPARINVYNEFGETGSRQIIVQGIQESPMGFSAHVVPRGFELLDDDSIRALRDDELYEYT